MSSHLTAAWSLRFTLPAVRGHVVMPVHGRLEAMWSINGRSAVSPDV